MNCPYCLEEIKDGALVCRYCGKEQPPSAEERKARTTKRRNTTIVVVLVAVVIIMILAGQSYGDQQQRLREAALCNGTLTADDLEAIAEKSAKESGQSLSQTQESVVAFACPSMAK